MIEKWWQISCNYCDATICAPLSNISLKEFLKDECKGWWRQGTIDICPECRSRGVHKRHGWKDKLLY